MLFTCFTGLFLDMQQMSNPVQINTKALVFALLGGGLAVYLIWSLIPPRSRLKVHMSWKTRKFVDIPDEIEKEASSTEIKSRNLIFTLGKQVFLYLNNI